MHLKDFWKTVLGKDQFTRGWLSDNLVAGVWLLILHTLTATLIPVSVLQIRYKTRINEEKAKLRSGHVARYRKIFVDAENMLKELTKTNNQMLLRSNWDFFTA